MFGFREYTIKTKTATKAFTELMLIALTGAFVLVLVMVFDPLARFVEQIGGILLFLVFAAISFGVFYWRRWRELAARQRADDEQRRSEEWLRSLVQNASDIITVVDADGTIKYGSPSIERVLGYSPQNLVGNNTFDYVHPDDLERTRYSFVRSLSATGMFSNKLEFRIRQADGSWRHVETAVTNLIDDPRVRGVVLNSRDVTERKEAEAKLRKAEARYRSLVESVPTVVYIDASDEVSSAIYMSPQVERMLGFSPQEWLDDPELWVKLLHPEDRQRVLAEDERTNQTGEPFKVEYRQFAKDGRVVWIHDEAALVRDEEGTPSYWLGVQYDITERKQAEGALKESELRLRSVITNVPVVLFALDHTGTFTLSEGKGLDILGLEAGEVVGRSVSELYGERPEILEDVDRALAGEEFSAEREVGTRTFETWYSPLRASTGEISGAIGVLADITQRKAFEAHLEFQAFHDPLTHLANRTSLTDRLKQALARLDHRRGYVAVITLDLDNFRLVNDSLGHEAGDMLLVTVAERLQRCCVRTGDTVARLGGDEFAVLLENIRGSREAVRVAERIEESLQTPISLREQEVSVTASIGIALGATNRDRPKDLLRAADTAMYWAKDRGKAQHEVFDPSMDTRASERLALEKDLRLAVDRNEFSLRYQPKILLDTGGVVGMTASVYWEHPQRGLMSPSEFIPVAEESRLILPIERWALREACQQAVEWQELHRRDLPMMLCADISARLFRDKDLTGDVARLLRETGLEPRSLNLRVSESAAMKDAQYAISTLEKLKSLGVQLSISSFGTGYSSLRYLNRLPVDFLVVDSSFVGNLWEGSADATVVSGMISLAHALGLTVVAEGVETPKQVAQLRRMGCNLVQGTYFSQPLTSEAASEFLASAYDPGGNRKAD